MLFPGSKMLKPQPETPTESLIIDFTSPSLRKSSPSFSQPSQQHACPEQAEPPFHPSEAGTGWLLALPAPALPMGWGRDGISN